MFLFFYWPPTSDLQYTLKRSREESAYNKMTGQIKSNGTMTLANGHSQKPLTEPLQFSEEWLIEDLESDAARELSDKELVSPPAKVVNKQQQPQHGDGQQKSEEDAESEYSSLEDDDDDDDGDFGDETRATEESLEEDVLDAMTKNGSDPSLLLQQVNGGGGNGKVAMKVLQGTVSGCVEGGRATTAPFSVSLFPNVPVYFSFANHLEAGPALPPCISKIMKWKLTPVTPVVVRKVLTNTGFRLLKRKLRL